MNDEKEFVILVDDFGVAIGIAPKIQAHIDGRKHRAFSAFIYNFQGEVLIQQRSETKYHSPLEWTNACCGHPRQGEALCSSVTRRVKEELGIDVLPKKYSSTSYVADLTGKMIENEFVYIVTAQYSGEIIPDPSEVHSFQWINPEQLLSDIKRDPTKYTKWLQFYVRQFPELFSNDFAELEF